MLKVFRTFEYLDFYHCSNELELALLGQQLFELTYT